ncbi:MAG: TldD/PmbA family protein [Acidobacteria bacterium]|nr:TldD/PmbA family protein [Acidobacteriota bacterium]
MDCLESRFDDAFLQKALAGVSVPRQAWADLFLERCFTQRVEWDTLRGLRRAPGLREGFALRQVASGEQRLVSEEGLQEESILRMCGQSHAGEAPQRGDSPKGGEPAAELDLSRVEQLVSAVAAALRSQVPCATALSIRAEVQDRQTCTARPGAPVRRDHTTRAWVTCRIRVPQGMVSAGMGAATMEALKAGEPASRIGSEIAQRAAHLGDAREVAGGEWPVILAPGTGGVFFHEACGHALEADLVLKGASPFRSLLGQRVGPSFLGAMDDSSQPGLEGSYQWDDEGSSCRGTVLIAKGVLKAFLSDRITAARLGRPTTGNGRRESFMDLPLPRMSNAFLMAGDEDPEAILRETKRGIYVHRLEGGRMDPATGAFLFRASSGSLIESGRLTTPLRPFTLAGETPAALSRIRRVGRDLSFGDGAGSCGKDGQQIPVASGLPTVLLDCLSIRPC